MNKFTVKEKYDIQDFISLISFLRSEDGCPWDHVQTHTSIRRNLLEEAFELAEQIDGDQIYVIGGAQIYKETFDIVDVLFELAVPPLAST